MTTTSRFPNLSRHLVYFLFFGLYLTFHGYHSRENDQAYRLPLLIDRQEPGVFAADPFVRAFDAFNPHRGYLMLLDVASRGLGLSLALFGLYALTFVVTVKSLDRLGRTVWPELPSGVGLVAVGLLLLTKAGNIGTNHLFEPLLLDRLMGFALGWRALLALLGDESGGPWKAGLAIGLAAWIHPSLGLQLGLLVGATWAVLAIVPGRGRVDWRRSITGLACLGIALAPALILQAGQSGALFEGLPVDEFVVLEAYVQSPQHLVPHLWRSSQWMAWGSLVILGVLSLGSGWRSWGAGKARLAVVLGINLLGLGLAYVAVELIREPRAILFQPFRMATVARGLALLALAGRVAALWGRGDLMGRLRAILLVVGLTGDWTLVIVTAFELAATMVEAWSPAARIGSVARTLIPLVVLAYGLVFLAQHDTESGHWRILAAAAVGLVVSVWSRRHAWIWTPRRVRWAVASCWALPLAAWAAEWSPPVRSEHLSAVRAALIQRCRFGEVPSDDMERLALWCRAHTPEAARFIGPPQPKTFRLWARRSLAFNRSGSPYHAQGLADWSSRFRDHVGFTGTTAEFAQAYLQNRQALEARYQRLSAPELAALAIRQGADHVLAGSGLEAADPESDRNNPLERLQVEGRYAVYRVRPSSEPALADRRP